MRLIDADELMEHVWRDKLDSRELIAKMIDDAPTVKEISTKIPINVFERLFSQEPKTGHWINQHVIYANATIDFKVCSECRYEFSYDAETGVSDANYCPNCGCRMIESQESEDKDA